ncbi:MAG: 3-deoxy-D-manno-octulosonate cytidylyltransferase [Sphingobacteriales bacterium]|jgi:3-deoxy-D-manno-octulosonate cytidylyltransferase
MEKIIAIIPARYGSSRFPGKPLAKIAGESMIRRVVKQVQKCEAITEVHVATDHPDIEKEVHDLCFVHQTGEHSNGTFRILEVAQKLNLSTEIVLNVQGDEPMLNPDDLDALILAVRNSKSGLGTLCSPMTREEAQNPNRVKVVKSKSGRALYFSRSPIPFIRTEGCSAFFKHIGLYGYRADVLAELAQIPESDYAKTESLEQLSWLENDYDIAISEVAESMPGVDVPEDINTVEKLLIRRG